MKKDIVKKIVSVFFTFAFLLFTLPKSIYAKVDIGSEFGFGNLKSLGEATGTIAPAIFSIATGMVVLYFVFGVFDYITAGGDKEGIEKAKKKITHAIVGFLILMFAFLTLQFLLYNLLGITGLKIIG